MDQHLEARSLARGLIVYLAVHAAKLIMRLPAGIALAILCFLRGLFATQRIKVTLTDWIKLLKAGPPDSLILKNILLNSRVAELNTQFEREIFGTSGKDEGSVYKRKLG